MREGADVDPPSRSPTGLFEKASPAFVPVLLLVVVLVLDPPAAFDYDYEADDEDDWRLDFSNSL